MPKVVRYKCEFCLGGGFICTRTGVPVGCSWCDGVGSWETDAQSTTFATSKEFLAWLEQD